MKARADNEEQVPSHTFYDNALLEYSFESMLL
jgi:hypothetical protein